MSGGSYDYLYLKVEEMADALSSSRTDPRRVAFGRLLTLIAKAMYEIEWVDSKDSGPGDEHPAIDACFSFLGASPDVIRKAHAYDGLKQVLTRYFASDKGEG